MPIPGLLLALAIGAALCGAAVCRSARMQRGKRADSAGRPEPRWGTDGGALPNPGASAAADGTVPAADGGTFPLHRRRCGLQVHKFTQEHT